MANKKYALLVENEIFDIFYVTDDPQNETLSRWAIGFSGQPVGMEITDIPGATIGSLWTGESFDNSDVSIDHINVFESGRKLYAILNESKIFMLINPADNYPKVQEMYDIAFSTNKVTGMDITEFPKEVTYEWTWNDGIFLSPGDI
jgi:hypothetical protein